MANFKHSRNDMLGSCSTYNKNNSTNIQSNAETNQDILSVQDFKTALIHAKFYVLLGQNVYFKISKVSKEGIKLGLAL